MRHVGAREGDDPGPLGFRLAVGTLQCCTRQAKHSRTLLSYTAPGMNIGSSKVPGMNIGSSKAPGMNIGSSKAPGIKIVMKIGSSKAPGI
jgi:hypothetical protein